MGERKVLNKYYPADFDPAKIPRRRQPKNQQMNVRMMLPMSIRCGTCGNYTYKGTKFNSRKEVVVGDSYLGLKIVRFYSKCSNCWAEITFVTDPQNSDYAVESGASRNFEPWRAEDEAREEEKKKRNAEEMGDAMKSLENTTLGSKREIDILAALDELKSMKSRRAKLTVDAMLEALPNYKAEEDEEEEAAYIRAVFLRGQNNTTTRRIIDDQDLDFDHPSPRPLKRNKLVSSSSNQPSDARLIKFSIIKKSTAQPPSSGLQSLFHHYGSDQDES